MSDGAKFVLLLAQVLTIASALIVTFHPNILYAAVALLFAFMGVAVMFIFAGADFIAGAQVIVYIGGVTILILFAVMLTQWLYQMKLRDTRSKLLIPLIIIGVGVLPFLFKALAELSVLVEKSPPQNPETFAASPKTLVIGQALLGNYLLPFEAITILLLGALVGAVWLARPK